MSDYPYNSNMFLFFEKFVPFCATKAMIGKTFKFLANYSGKIEFLTLYDINRGITWGRGVGGPELN